MPTDRRRVLSELPLPLGQDAGVLEALEIALAVEDACDVTLPEDMLTVAHLATATAVESALDNLAPPR